MTFTTANLTGERVLVKGTDRFGTDGQQVIDASEWNEVKRHTQFEEANDSFEAAVNEFFEPLMVAAEKLESSMAKPVIDHDSYITVREGTEAVQGRDEVVIKLSPASVVLRLIERGDTDRLVWVNEQLEVLQVEEPKGAQHPDISFNEPVDDDSQADASADYADGTPEGE